MTGLEARNRIRAEAARLQRLADREYKRPVKARRQHVIDGLQVAIHVLRRLAADMAQEAQTAELVALTDLADEPDELDELDDA